MKSWYEILEVPRSASTAEIRSAYLKMVREYHPDRVPEHLTKLRADAEDKFKQVQAAWAVLGDPAKRRRYDLSDRVHEVPSSPSPAQPIRPPEGRQIIRAVLRRRGTVVRRTRVGQPWTMSQSATRATRTLNTAAIDKSVPCR